MRVSLNGLKVNVTKYLTLLLFIGLGFWGCEDDKPLLDGTWLYYNSEMVDLITEPTDWYYNWDSSDTYTHNLYINNNYRINFTNDSAFIYRDSSVSKFEYYVDADTLYLDETEYQIFLNDNNLELKRYYAHNMPDSVNQIPVFVTYTWIEYFERE